MDRRVKMIFFGFSDKLFLIELYKNGIIYCGISYIYVMYCSVHTSFDNKRTKISLSLFHKIY